ncbi:MAG: AAA family ATPase [Elusimicrobia bacterium]|nr:AAA family ATPase [Elusimicrobiota bacterium]
MPSLRSYVELNKDGFIAVRGCTGTNDSRHVLLFEEPELYLHPKAQQVLFDALELFTKAPSDSDHILRRSLFPIYDSFH